MKKSFSPKIIFALLLGSLGCSPVTGPENNAREVEVEVTYNPVMYDERYDPPVIHCTGWIRNIDTVPCSVDILLTCVAGEFEGEMYYGLQGPPRLILNSGSKAYWAVVGWGRGLMPYEIKFICLETSLQY